MAKDAAKPEAQTESPRLLTIGRVMGRLDVSRRTVYRLIERGWLPPGKRMLDGTVRWADIDVEVFIRKWDQGEFEDQLEAEEAARPARKPSRKKGTRPSKE